MKNAFFWLGGETRQKKNIPLAPVTPSLVYFWSHLCLDRGFGLVFRGQGLPEEQLEHSRRNAGVDFSHWHPGVSHLELRHQDPGHAQSPEAAEDAEAAAVSVLPRDVKMQNIWCYTWSKNIIRKFAINKGIFRYVCEGVCLHTCAIVSMYTNSPSCLFKRK